MKSGEKKEKINIRSIDFKSFFNQLFPSLCVFAYKFVKDEEVAKDLVQDVFTKIWNNAIEFESKNSIKTYFYLSTKNKCFDYLKQNNKRIKVSGYNDHIENSIEFSDETIINEIIREETYRLLKECLEYLPSQSRKILLLNLMGFSNQEIAEKLSVSINTIKTHKLNAYRKIREIFGNQFAIWLLYEFYDGFFN